MADIGCRTSTECNHKQGSSTVLSRLNTLAGKGF